MKKLNELEFNFKNYFNTFFDLTYFNVGYDVVNGNFNIYSLSFSGIAKKGEDLTICIYKFPYIKYFDYSTDSVNGQLVHLLKIRD